MTLQERIEELWKDSNREIAAIKHAIAATERLEPIMQELQGLGFLPEPYVCTWKWAGMTWGEAGFRITLKDQDSWACAIPIMEKLVAYGFSEESWESIDDAKNFARTYSARVLTEGKDPVTGDYWKEEIKILLTVMLKEGNTGGCRRVFVGTKKDTRTTEVEEYKLVCDEELPA